MNIQIKKLSEQEINEMGIKNWGIWSKEVSEFDWFYDSKEYCLIIEGEVEVSSEFETVKFGKGDFVIFPEGLKCRWKISKPVKKYYNFEDND